LEIFPYLIYPYLNPSFSKTTADKLPQDGEDFKCWGEIKENLSLFNLLQIKQKAEQKGLLFKEIGF